MDPILSFAGSTSDHVVVFAGVALALVILAAVLRTVISRGGRHGSGRHLSPLELAYLSGGPPRAVLSCLATLRMHGAIRSGGHRKVDVVPGIAAPHDITPLEQAVWQAVQEHRASNRLGHHRRVRAEIKRLRAGLIDEGMLSSKPRRALARLLCLLPLAWLAVGVSWVQHGPFRTLDQETDALLYVTLGTAGVLVVAFFQLLTRPRSLTRRGDDMVGAARMRYEDLGPNNRPAWQMQDRHAFALAVGIFGIPALATLDPDFAYDVRARMAASSTSGDGGGSCAGCSSGGDSGGGWDGGGGGCGGGGSSCGGGGGCGGGGCGGGS